VRADVHPGWLTGSADVFRRLAEIRASSNWSAHLRLEARSSASRAERRFLRHLHGGLPVRYGFSRISHLS